MSSKIETRIIAHHVGGRGFVVAFNTPDRFRHDIQHVLYEADAESIAQMEENPDVVQAQLMEKPVILPYCLGSGPGRAKLNVTANAFASSLLRPNEDFFKFYCELGIPPSYYDVTYDDMMTVIKEVEVDVHAMDDLFDQGKIPSEARPDFLSLDTQGFEHAIMEGAKTTIGQHVLAIATEVEILPMYKDQPLLADILTQMNDFGFYFAGFLELFEVSLNRSPVGLRGKSLPGFGDALFLRRLDTIEDVFPDESERAIKLRKMGFIALNFGYVDYALKALEMASELQISASSSEELSQRIYDGFLNEFVDAAASVERLFPPKYDIPEASRPKDHPPTPPTWHSQHHAAVVNNFHRLQAEELSNTATHPASHSPNDRNPVWAKIHAWLLYVFVLRPRNSQTPLRHLMLRHPLQFVGKFTYYILVATGLDARWETTPAAAESFNRVETLLADYGFTATAALLQQRRIPREKFLSSIPSELRQT